MQVLQSLLPIEDHRWLTAIRKKEKRKQRGGRVSPLLSSTSSPLASLKIPADLSSSSDSMIIPDSQVDLLDASSASSSRFIVKEKKAGSAAADEGVVLLD